MAADWQNATPDDFKMIILQADLEQEHQTWEGWKKMISGALALCGQHGFAETFVVEYGALVNAGDRADLMRRVFADQLDNYILGSLALRILDVPRDFR